MIPQKPQFHKKKIQPVRALAGKDDKIERQMLQLFVRYMNCMGMNPAERLVGKLDKLLSGQADLRPNGDYIIVNGEPLPLKMRRRA